MAPGDGELSEIARVEPSRGGGPGIGSFAPGDQAAEAPKGGGGSRCDGGSLLAGGKRSGAGRLFGDAAGTTRARLGESLSWSAGSYGEAAGCDGVGV